MRIRTLAVLAIVGAAVTALMSAPASAQRGIILPGETVVYRENNLPGYQLVQRNCGLCHSAEYAASQPPALPRSYWDATVKKMKKPFGATFPDEDVPAMVDYLVKTYGTERSGAKPAGFQAP
jgi:cytochrome c5